MADIISRDAIAARAYALYVRRGREPGHALDDWLEAERQLRALASATAHAHPPVEPQRSLTGRPPSPASSTAASAAATVRSAGISSPPSTASKPPALPPSKPGKSKRR